MKTNDVNKNVEKTFNFYEQLFDKFLDDAIDNGLGNEEILGAATLLFLDVVVCSKLSSDGVYDHHSKYAQNKRVEFSNKLRNLLNEFLSENNEYINETIQEDSRTTSSK